MLTGSGGAAVRSGARPAPRPFRHPGRIRRSQDHGVDRPLGGSQLGAQRIGPTFPAPFLTHQFRASGRPPAAAVSGAGLERPALQDERRQRHPPLRRRPLVPGLGSARTALFRIAGTQRTPFLDVVLLLLLLGVATVAGGQPVVSGAGSLLLLLFGITQYWMHQCE